MDNFEYRKIIFDYLHNLIGFTPKIVEYRDETEEFKILIYIGVDRPDFELTTYSTVGLSEHSIDEVNSKGKDIRAEIIGMCNSDVTEFANIISTCAFNIIKDNYPCWPGAVHPYVVKEYYNDIDMEHIFFTIPFEWDDLQSFTIYDKVITWLMAIPISDNEYEYLLENGYDALNALFVKESIQYFDIHRKSLL